jgi:hypothetical protein
MHRALENGRATHRAVLLVGVALATTWVTWSAPASAGGGPVDGAPSGNVAFFVGVTECPSGWTVAEDVAGRLVVAVTDDRLAGVTVGVPLGDREDRTHTHALSASLELPSRTIAGADGANRSGAASGTVPIDVETSAASTGLPFVQVLACQRP